MKKTITAIAAAMMLAATAGAQEQQPQDTSCNKAHYITLDFGGGYHNLVYSLGDKGKREPGMGIMGRIGYRYFFSKHWGAGINVVYKQSLTHAKINYESDPESRIDTENEEYDFIIQYNNLKEKQKQTSIAIPLGIYFQGNITPKWKAGFGAGVSMQFVNDDTFEIDGGDISAYAYYHNDNVKFSNMPNHNLPAPKSDFKCSYDYKTAFGAFAEINFMYALARWVDLDLGIYGGYGLSKSTKSNDHTLYEYKTEADNHYYGALNSNFTKGSRPLAIGFMAGFRFKLGKNPVEKKPAEEEVKQVVVVDNTKPQNNQQQPEVKQTEEQQQPENQQIADNKADEQKPENGQVINITDIVSTNPSNQPADNNQNVKPADNQNVKPVEPKKNENKVYTEKGKEVYINGRKYVVVDTIRMIINFDLGESGNPDITVVDQTLDDVAKYLKEHPDYKLSIVGHTCDLGSDATNKRIGLARANTVKQEFIKRGIPASRLLTSTKASSQPLVPNTSDQNRSRNRRVELEYVK